MDWILKQINDEHRGKVIRCALYASAVAMASYIGWQANKTNDAVSATPAEASASAGSQKGDSNQKSTRKSVKDKLEKRGKGSNEGGRVHRVPSEQNMMNSAILKEKVRQKQQDQSASEKEEEDYGKPSKLGPKSISRRHIQYLTDMESAPVGRKKRTLESQQERRKGGHKDQEGDGIFFAMMGGYLSVADNEDVYSTQELTPRRRQAGRQ